jgi:YtcA family
VNPHLSKFVLILIEAPLFQTCGSFHEQVPSLDVFGSYFPAWLISLAAGILLTVVAGGLGNLIDIRPSGFLRFIVDVSLILIFSISVWFWFFAG